MEPRPFAPEDVEIILAELRAGAVVSVGGSRCHRDWFWRDGWKALDFDEGATDEHDTTEASVREAIAADPRDFVFLRRAPHLRAVTAAFLAGDRVAARAALRLAMEWGDPLDQGAVLDAYLRWPQEPPTEAELAIIRDKLRNFTAWHVFMDTTRWEKTPQMGRRGVAFIDRLLEMAGHEPRAYGIRASFHEMAGDLAAALGDVRVELAGAAPEDWWRKGVEERLRALEIHTTTAGSATRARHR